MNYIPSKISVLGDAPLSREDQLRLEVWQKLRVTGFAHIDAAHRDTRVTVALSSLRARSPHIFRHLCRVDDECASIARARGWSVDRGEDDWRDITEPQVRTKLRELEDHPRRLSWGLMLAGALRRYAPQHLGLLPPEFLALNADRSAA